VESIRTRTPPIKFGACNIGFRQFVMETEQVGLSRELWLVLSALGFVKLSEHNLYPIGVTNCYEEISNK